MKPLGQKPIKMNHTDCHPPKGFVNWWEVDGCYENKTADKESAKKSIAAQLKEELSEQS